MTIGLQSCQSRQVQERTLCRVPVVPEVWGEILYCHYWSRLGLTGSFAKRGGRPIATVAPVVTVSKNPHNSRSQLENNDEMNLDAAAILNLERHISGGVHPEAVQACARRDRNPSEEVALVEVNSLAPERLSVSIKQLPHDE